MNKNKSPKRKLAKYLMILPLAVVLMMTNCVQEKIGRCFFTGRNGAG